MRGRVLAFLVINICVVVFLIHSVWTLLSLLVVDGSQYAISPDDLPALDSGMKDDKAQIIPKIIHQTYINTSIPPVWQEAQNSCIELHKDYEYILWTDKMSRDFIAKEYSWFLETFDNYPFGIMRADAIRYFVLYHHGGVYIDLDDVRPFDSLTVQYSMPSYEKVLISSRAANVDLIHFSPTQHGFDVPNLQAYPMMSWAPFPSIHSFCAQWKRCPNIIVIGSHLT